MFDKVIRKIAVLVTVAAIAALGATAARAQQVPITVTPTPTPIVVNENCNYVKVLENSITPSATFSITLAGTAIPLSFGSGASYTFTAPAGQQFVIGQVLGTITSNARGPFNFIAIEAGPGGFPSAGGLNAGVHYSSSFYAPSAGSGLTLNLAAGEVDCSGALYNYSAGTLTMADASTNYVFLSSSGSCAPASNTTGFAATPAPIATVITSGGQIVSVTDNRTSFIIGANGSMVYPSAGVACSTGTAWCTPYQVGTAANDIPQLNGSGRLPSTIPVDGNALTATALLATPSQCSGSQFATGIGANGSANCATPSGGGNVSSSGTPTAAQVAIWINATQIEGLSTLPHGMLPTLLSADIPNNAANTSGLAAMATALAAAPTQCSGSQFSTGVAANGNANCATPSGSGSVGSGTQYAFSIYPTSGTGVGSGPAPPTTPGEYFCGYNLPTSSSVAPSCWQNSLQPRAGDPSSSGSDTIASTDAIVKYSGSVAVAIALPTPTTLNNSGIYLKLINNTTGSATALTVTAAGSYIFDSTGTDTKVIAQGQYCALLLHPSGTVWDDTCSDLPMVAGTNVTIARGPNGFTVSSSGAGSSPVPGIDLTPATAAANSTSAQQLEEVALSAGFFNTANAPFSYETAGSFSTAAGQTPTLTFVHKLCTVSGCGSGTAITLDSFTTGASIASSSANPWRIAGAIATVIAGSSGQLEVHGTATVDIGASASAASSSYGDGNTAISSAIDLSGALYFDTFVTTSNGNTGNVINERLTRITPAGTPPAISLTISPSTASVATSATQAFAGTATNDFSGRGGTWSLSGSGCSGSTCGTLSSTTTTGTTYTAPSSVPSPASVTLTWTSIADSSKTATATITVTSSGGSGAVFTYIQTQTAENGCSSPCNASITPTTGNALVVEWMIEGSGTSPTPELNVAATIIPLFDDATLDGHEFGAYLVCSAPSGVTSAGVSYAGGGSALAVNVEEYSYSGSCAADQVSSLGSGNGTTITAGSVTTTAANELIIGTLWQYDEDGAVTPSGFNDRTDDELWSLETLTSLDKIVTSTGTFTAAGTVSTSAHWGAYTISIK